MMFGFRQVHLKNVTLRSESVQPAIFLCRRARTAVSFGLWRPHEKAFQIENWKFGMFRWKTRGRARKGKDRGGRRNFM